MTLMKPVDVHEQMPWLYDFKFSTWFRVVVFFYLFVHFDPRRMTNIN